MGKFIDLKGQIFGNYTVIEYTEKQLWKCQCSCGKISFIKGNSLTAGRHKSCKSCALRLPKGEAGLNRLFSKYSISANKKNRVFLLTKEEFKKLTSSNCHYCGIKPYLISFASTNTTDNNKIHSKYTYNGIDRMDNNKGYETSNCVSCCETCNMAKRNMSYTAFINYIKRIIKYYGKN